MRNRIGHLFQEPQERRELAADRPKLTLHMERPFSVDMERFFDFTFSFAEALLDLEAKFKSEPKVTSLERHLADTSNAAADEFEYDIDARWM